MYSLDIKLALDKKFAKKSPKQLEIMMRTISGRSPLWRVADDLHDSGR